MASDSKPFGLKIQGPWNWEQAENKRKGAPGERSIENGKRVKTREDNEEEHIYPEILVKVEVNDTDETISPAEFNEQNYNEPPEDPPSPRMPRPSRRPPAPAPSPQPKKKKRKKHYFPCEICGQEFTQRFNMQRHKAIHTGDNKCDYCGAIFNTKAYLTRHIRSKHSKTDKDTSSESEYEDEEDDEEEEDKKKEETSKEDIKIIDNKSDVDQAIQNAIVSKMHKGVQIKDISRLYHITPEVIKQIWDDRDKFVLPKKIPRRSVKYMNSILEPYVLEWYNKEKTKVEKFTGRMFQEVAEKIAREKGMIHFNAGVKWLEQFKKKNNIYLNTRRRDYKNRSEDSIWKVRFFQEQWSAIRSKYTDDEIYMADEVGFYYNPSKSRERKLAGRKFVCGDPSDRFAIFLCTNVSGTDKRKLLVIGSEDPLKNSHRSPSTLPVEYRRHPESHLTTYIFETHMKAWDAQLKKDKKKAVVIVDRASVHSKLTLDILDLTFLPWKGVNSLMPIKNGIYAKFRSEFRNLSLQFKAMNVVKGIDRHLTCLEGLEMLEKAWERTPPEIITKSFIDLGYEVQTLYSYDDQTNSDKGDERLCEFLKDYDVDSYYGDVASLDMYLTVDENVLVGKGTNPTLFGGNHKNTEPVEPVNDDTLPLNTNQPESNEKEIIVRKSNALSDIEIVRKYLLSNNTSYETYGHFLDVEKEVMEHFVKFNN